MIETIAKALLSEKSRVTIQLGILLSLVTGAFYFGFQTKDFIEAQRATTRTLDKLNRQYNSMWSYEMQRDFVAELKNNNPDIVAPIVSEIRERNAK